MQIEKAAETLATQYRDTLIQNGVAKDKADRAQTRVALTFASMLASEIVQADPLRVRPE